MKKRLCTVLATAAALSAVVGVASASAATEFGSGCAANSALPFGPGLVSTAHGAGSPLPLAAPTSGVLTEWKINVGFSGITPSEEAEAKNVFAQQLVVLRPSTPNHYTVVGKAESTNTMNFHGLNTYPARIAVQQGDVLSLQAPVTLLCEETHDPADVTALYFGSSPVGGGVETEGSESEMQVPVQAKIEPDVDNDGYGDETQDKCPQSAAYQTPCPVVTISSLPTVGKKAVTLYVSTSLSAPVGVTATVNLGKGKTAALSAATQTVAPGTLTPFVLTLTSQVNKALKKLPTKRSLQMSIVASATNVTGSPSTSATTVKLKGQAKPVHKKHHKKKKSKKKK